MRTVIRVTTAMFTAIMCVITGLTVEEVFDSHPVTMFAGFILGAFTALVVAEVIKETK